MRFVLEHEPAQLEKLIEFRVPVTSEAVIDHPDIVVLMSPPEQGTFELGVLGLINGLLGRESRIMAHYDNNGCLTGFS